MQAAASESTARGGILRVVPQRPAAMADSDRAGLGLDPARRPRLCRWLDAALRRPAVARTVTRDWWWWW